MTLLRKGDSVHIFDPADPDGEAPLRTVARVAGKRDKFWAALWLEGESGPAQWQADGSEKREHFSRDPRKCLLRPADLEAARAEARKQRTIERRRQLQGAAQQALATKVRQAATAIEHEDGIEGAYQRAADLYLMLGLWMQCRCPGCSACTDNHVEPLCDGSGLRGDAP